MQGKVRIADGLARHAPESLLESKGTCLEQELKGAYK